MHARVTQFAVQPGKLDDFVNALGVRETPYARAQRIPGASRSARGRLEPSRRYG